MIRKTLLAALCLGASQFAAPAHAAKMLVTFSGTISYGFDDLGQFSPAGTILTGMNAVTRYTIDTGAPTLFALEDTAAHSRLDSGTGYGLPFNRPAVLATLTINNHTMTIGHYTASAQWSRGIIGNGDYEHLLYFGASNQANALANIALFYTHGSAPSAHITEAFDFAIADSNQSYYGQGVNNVNTVVNWHTSHITSEALGVPEPAAWALLLGGFGAVGAVRRRKNGASTAFA